jgi:hypothetical protein
MTVPAPASTAACAAATAAGSGRKGLASPPPGVACIRARPSQKPAAIATASARARASEPVLLWLLHSKRLLIESRWLSKPLASAGKLRPRRLNNWPFGLTEIPGRAPRLRHPPLHPAHLLPLRLRHRRRRRHRAAPRLTRQPAPSSRRSTPPSHSQPPPPPQTPAAPAAPYILIRTERKMPAYGG